MKFSIVVPGQLAFVALASLVLATGGGRAAAQTAPPQAKSVALDRFSPGEAGSEWFALDVLNLRGRARWDASMVVDDAYHPLVLRSTEGGSDQAVVSNQLVMYLQGAVFLADRVRLALSLPLVLFESGQPVVVDGAAYPQPEAGVGDPRIGADVRLFGNEKGLIVGAAGLQADIPIHLGDRRYGRENDLRLAPHFAVAGRLADVGQLGTLVYAGRVGLLLHLPRDLDSELPRGTDLELAGALGLRVWRDRLLLGPELYGATMLDGNGPFAKSSSPLEVLIGGHYHNANGFGAGIGVAAGLVQATGTPPIRFLLALNFTPRTEIQ
jgi:OOP family OmpA-OmpF porin